MGGGRYLGPPIPYTAEQHAHATRMNEAWAAHWRDELDRKFIGWVDHQHEQRAIIRGCKEAADSK